MSNPGTILVAMSGGVDSSVAAAILVEQGRKVIGATLRVLPCADDGSDGSLPVEGQRCCSAADIEDARAAATKLGIPHYVVNAREEFSRAVLEPFIRDYGMGRTPSPCIPCNRELKFGLLLERAEGLGAGRIATGHYARVEGGVLRRGADPERDQTYFLFGIPRMALAKIEFPLGGMTKHAVREKARALGLPVADKPDSQEVCFIPGGDTAEFLAGRIPDRPGPVLDMDGKVLGRHRGLHFFTIGRRRGLGISSPEPLFVTDLDPARDAVIVGPSSGLSSPGCEVESVNWLVDGPPAGAVEVKIRSRHPGVAASVEDAREGRVRVRFSSPQRAVTPGQAAVFYRGEEVLGGGTICAALRFPP